MISVLYPSSPGEAEAIARSASGKYVAGGTALQLEWEGATPPSHLVDLSGLPGWRGISRKGNMLRIGAGALLEQCRTDADVVRYAPLLAQACAAIAAFSIRNLGTLGGNICWRQGDTLPALLAMEALLEPADGNLVTLPDWLQRMPLQPALLLAVHLPLSARPQRVFLEKVGHRAAFSPALAVACGAMTVDSAGTIQQARLVVSGMGITATRLTAVESILAGAKAHSRNWRRAFEDKLRDALGTLPNSTLQQQRMLHRMLAGHVYAQCEDAA